MVRCTRCKKSYKSHASPSWEEKICNKCWHSPEKSLEYDPQKVVTRQISNPFDFYLDLYTWQEMKLLQN